MKKKLEKNMGVDPIHVNVFDKIKVTNPMKIESNMIGPVQQEIRYTIYKSVKKDINSVVDKISRFIRYHKI